MSLFTLATLLVARTKAELYEAALDIAEFVGLPVTSWQAGDPTRSNYHYFSEVYEANDRIAAEIAAAGFLDFAGEDWIAITGEQVYGTQRIEATFATTDVVLTNNGGGVFDGIEAGDLTFKNTTTNKTYRNSTGGDLSAGPATTLTVTVVADEAGSASSAAPNDIDFLVSGLPDVTCTNPTAAVGLDQESLESFRDRSRLSIGSWSAGGPADAFDFIARTPERSGTTAVTRSRTLDDSDTGDVVVYLAGPSGAVSAPDVALVEAALVVGSADYPPALCLCHTLTVESAVNVTITPTYSLWLYSSVGKTSGEVEDEVEAALIAALATRPIGGDVIPTFTGRIYHSWLESIIRGVYPDHCFAVTLSIPSGNTDLDPNEVAVLGAPTPTIVFVGDP